MLGITGKYKCKNCDTEYSPEYGMPEVGITKGVEFQNLDSSFVCPLCETPKNEFRKIEI